MTYLFKFLVGTRFGKILLALVQEILQVADTVHKKTKGTKPHYVVKVGFNR